MTTRRIPKGQRCSICGQSLGIVADIAHDQSGAPVYSHVKCLKSEAKKNDPRQSDPRHLARYTHKDYLRWVGKDSQPVVAIRSAANIKAALLAIGTKGYFHLYEASTAHSSIVKWRQGVSMFNWAKATEPGGRVYELSR